MYACMSVCLSERKPLNSTETSFRRALISNNSVSLVLKKELWVGTKNIGAGRGWCGGGGGYVYIHLKTNP